MARVERDARAAYLDNLAAEGAALPDQVSSPVLQSEATRRLLVEFADTASAPGEIQPNALERVHGRAGAADHATGGRLSRYGQKFAEVAADALQSGNVSVSALTKLGLEAAIDAGSAIYRWASRPRTQPAVPHIPEGTTFVTPEHLRWFLNRE